MTSLLVASLLTVVQARVLIVIVAGGDAMFARSVWLQRALTEGTAGWLVPTANHAVPSREWDAALWLVDYETGEPATEVGAHSRAPLPRDTHLSGTPPPAVRLLPLLPDAGMAFGIRTAPEALPRAWQRDIRQSKWLYVHLSEVERALRYAEFCTPAQAEQLLQRAWQQIDRWLALLAQFYNQSDDLMIVVGSSLTAKTPWAVWLRGGQVGRGWLWDDSVRVRGAGQTLSLNPTIFVALGWRIRPGLGAPLRGDGTSVKVEALLLVRDSWLKRQPLWRGALWIRAVWIGLVLLGCWWAYRMGREIRQRAAVRLRVVGQPSPAPRPASADTSPAWRALVEPATWGVWGVALGVASLLPAALPTSILWSATLIVLLGMAMLGWLARALDTPLVGLGAIAGLGLIALVLDTLSGGDWNRDGLFGYTLLGGYRFYGVGNPYAALALSWVLILCAAWLRIEGLPLGALILLALFTLWMGWQSANVGATLATIGTLLAFGIALTAGAGTPLLRRKRVSTMLGLGGVALVSLVLLWFNTPHLHAFWASLTEPASPAHSPDASQLIARKIAMNLGESLLSPWAVLLLTSLLAVRWLRRTQVVSPIPRPLQIAWLTAGVLCFLLNDLGMLMAAMIAFHYWALLFTQSLQEMPHPTANRTHARGGERR